MGKYQLGLPLQMGFPLHLIDNDSAPSLASSTALRVDALNEQTAMCGRVWWPDRTDTSKTIVGVHWCEANALAGTFNCRVGVQDMSGASQGVPDGTFDHYKDVTSTTTGPVETTFDTGTPKAVNWGDPLAIVWKMTSYTSGRVQPGALGARSANDGMVFSAFVKTDTVGNWSAPVIQLFLANLVLEFDDGTYGTLIGATPAFHTINTETFNSATAGSGLGTGDERALRLTVGAKLWVEGFAGIIMPAAASSDFDVGIYSGTSLQQSKSYDATMAKQVTTPERDQYLHGELGVVPGTTYYQALKPTTANDVTLYSADVSEAAFLTLFAGGFATVGYDCRADGGAWQNPAGSDKRMPLWGSLVSAIDDGNNSIVTGHPAAWFDPLTA